MRRKLAFPKASHPAAQAQAISLLNRPQSFNVAMEIVLLCMKIISGRTWSERAHVEEEQKGGQLTYSRQWLCSALLAFLNLLCGQH